VNIYADAAEGISTSFFTEYRYAGDYPYMQQALPVNLLLFSPIVMKSNRKATEPASREMETVDTLIMHIISIKIHISLNY
jgi:hypothetical protein